MPRIKADSIAAHKEQSRRAIIDAAEALLVEYGYAGVALGDVADEAGIARTTFYEYYANKDQLVLGVVEHRVPPALQELVDDLPRDRSPGRCLLELERRVLAYTVEHIEMAILVMRIGRKLPVDEQTRMWAALDPVLHEIGRRVLAAIGQGEVVTEHPELTIRMVADVLIDGVDMLVRSDDPAGDLDAVTEVVTTWTARSLGVSDD